MGKNKVRLKSGSGGGAKAARWPKGQSSNSNPVKNRHRTAAKSRYFHHAGGGDNTVNGGGATKLTMAALMRHDAVLGDASLAGAAAGSHPAAQEEGETLTLRMTNKTFDTFASDWTQCTNVAFDKLLKKFQLQNAGHKEMLAVLAAVTEVIKSQNGAETETEYFAALMTTLEVSNTEENLAAVIRLLSLVIKKVPPEILISRFSQICEVLLATLAQHAESQSVALVRGLLGCLSVVLRVQPPAVWTQLPETGKVFQSLLTYTAHSKPKIRKAGQHAVVAVVRGGEAGPSGVHPAASLAANHCISVISSSGPTDNAVLYMLVLLRELLPAMPRAQTKAVCETILKLLTLGSNIMVSTGFVALHGLFSSRPAATSLSAELNGQLITALYDYQPSINDTGPVVAWLAVMQEGLLNLTQLNPSLCHTHLNKFCLAAVGCWLSDKPEVVKSAGLALRAVIAESLKGAPKDSCTKFVGFVGEGLKYQYHMAWPVVLSTLAALAEVVGGERPEALSPVLTSLAELRGSANFSLEAEVDHVVGRAVAAMGPARLLAAIPLNITGAETDYEFRSSWLLPVLRDNIRNTELAHFISYFLPLAAKCLDRSLACGAQQDRVGQKTYEVLTYQIWSLLPGYCTNPTDLADSFKNIARILGTQLGQRKEIRLDILTGLRHLLSSRNLDSTVASNSIDGGAELGRYAKNFLPILFNLYTTKPAGSEEAGQRLASLETIKLYLKITDTDLLGVMFDRALEKFTTQGVDQFTKDAVLDLLRCLLLYVEESRIQRLYEEATKRINSLDHKEQKKAYRVLEEICRGGSPAGRAFLARSLPQLQNLLLTALSATSPSSQAPRLRCLLSIISQLQEPGSDFALSVIPEAILCIKAVNKKAREGAFTLLVAVGEAMQRWNPNKDQDTVIRQYMEAILVGLAGNPRLIHCTLLAVSRIYFQFRDIFPQDLTEMILTNVLLLLSSSSREVASSALSFIKVFVTTTPVNEAARFVPQIVEALCRMPEDCQRHFRIKSKYLFERLSRKFGHDLVASLVPKSDEKTHKRLKNIRKELARRARRVSEDGSGQDEDDASGLIRGRQKTMEELLADSSDDDLDDESSGPIKDKGKKKKGGKNAAWIQEGGDDGIVDLLSKDAASRILSTRPDRKSANGAGLGAEARKRQREKADGGFKVGADGRLIITEKSGGRDSEEEGEDTIMRKNTREMSDSEDETFESLVASNNNRKRKRGTSEASIKSGRTAASGMTAMSGRSGSQYQPGGSGIHRKLNSSAASSRPGSEYLSKQGRGDVKKKGRPDPYAYIPLSHNSLNKRKQAKAKGQFNSVVKAARKGAGKGSKQRIHEVKRMIKDMKVS